MADPPYLPALMPIPGTVATDGAPTDATARVRALVEEHYDSVWRTLRHLGLDDATAEDGAQQVMAILARRIDGIRPGVERSFLLAAAVRVAATLRRTARRRAETTDEEIDALVASTPSSEELLDERRARDVLQRVLDAIPTDLRTVFVLYEIEEMTTREIAETLGVPHGTAQSRLRRAREVFEAIVRRMQAIEQGRGR
jgi:RNA polymerase sigma-70 factor (ECF subfamily)